MSPPMRNAVIWIGTILVCLALYWFAARTNLHFIQPLRFLGYVALAAITITALISWEFIAAARQTDAVDSPDRPKDD